MSANRIPPHDVAAEEAILGAVLLRNDALDQLELRAEEFYVPRHRAVFEAMRSLQASGRPLDLLTVENELSRRGTLASIGGLGFLSDVMDATPTADNIAHYAAIVSDASLKREVIGRASEIAARAFRDDMSGEEMLAELAGAASGIHTPAKSSGITMRDAARKYIDELGQQLAAKERGEQVSTKLQTGIATLDALLAGGLPLSNMHILAGRPSMGKSALARLIASSVNARGGGVHVFSVEDSTQAYVMRQFADEADVDLGRLTNLDVSRVEWKQVTGAADALFQRGERWTIDDVRGISIADIALKVKRARKTNRTELVVIDYAQLLSGVKGVKYENEQVRFAAISKGAADLARQEGVVVLLLSQLNRSSTKREDARPTMEDLRGSGAFEQDADVILMVHRPEFYLLKQDGDSPETKRQLELWRGRGLVLLEKAKNAPAPARTALAWDASRARFRDLGSRYASEAA